MHIKQPQNSAMYDRKYLFFIHKFSELSCFQRRSRGLAFRLQMSTPCTFRSSETHELLIVCFSLGNDRNARDQALFNALLVSYPLTSHWPKRSHVTNIYINGMGKVYLMFAMKLWQR